MNKIELKNLLVKAKVASKDIDKDWLQTAKDQALEKQKRGFVKLPSMPFNEIEADEEDPAVFIIEPLDDTWREVTFKDGVSKGKVIDVLVHKSSDTKINEGEKYSLWIKKTLEKEFEALPMPRKGSKFILAYYGRYSKKEKRILKRTETPKQTDAYVFRAIPQE